MELLHQTPANLAETYGMEATITFNQDDINNIVFAIGESLYRLNPQSSAKEEKVFQTLYGLLSDLVSKNKENQ